MAEGTCWIRMLGNHQELEYGQEYEVEVSRANLLTGIGMAVQIEGPSETGGAEAREEN